MIRICLLSILLFSPKILICGIVDSLNDVGKYCSISPRDYSDISISYYDATKGNLKYAEIMGASVMKKIIVDTAGNVGMYTSIACNQSFTAISYYDSTNGDLKYACCNNYDTSTSWNIETVDTTGDVGMYTSIRFSIYYTYTPSISYYDATNGDLKYAYRDSSGWHIEVVDTIGNVGLYSSLFIEYWEPYTPSISYYDATNGDLKYAYRDSSGWHIEVVDTIGNVGLYSSLTEENNEYYPYKIFYYDSTNGDLKMASGDTLWYINCIDTVGDVGRGISRNEANYGWDPLYCEFYISYYDATNQDLKNCQGEGGWCHTLIDTTGNIGLYSACCRVWAIALPPPGCEYIIYYDATNGDLKYIVNGLSIEENSGEKTKILRVETSPNPLTYFTIIKYSLPFKTKISLKIYDIVGRVVKTLVNEEQKAGNYSINLDMKDLSSGIYFAKLETTKFKETKKIIILR